ncbi:hypothetical protein BDR03DRAFT_708915 [Suillus americanus]|nr:hypothetical protein BDR03DRAFT_708915 [Suillus americanus]
MVFDSEVDIPTSIALDKGKRHLYHCTICSICPYYLGPMSGLDPKRESREMPDIEQYIRISQIDITRFL